MTDRIPFLRRLPYFAGLSEADVERICRAAPELVVAPGELLITEGGETEAMYVVVEGEFEVVRASRGQEVTVGRAGPGEVLGEMSLLERIAPTASVRALQESRVIAIGEDAFASLLASGDAVRAMLRTAVSRLRSAEATLREREKLAALGTLTAGLMHELNNPAAAVRRGAVQLEQALGERRELDARLADAGIAAAPDRVRSGTPPTSPLDRSGAEEELASWLADHGVDGPWALAPALVARGWTSADLEAATSHVPPDLAGTVAHRIALDATIADLVDEIGAGARRLSELVDAAKRYAYVGRAPVEDVDVHDSIDDTLVIMRHAIGDISVELERAPDLPTIEAYGSELNQVWTNLIGNAIDAMAGTGDLRITTRGDDRGVVVEVTDSGPGIDPEVRERIFEPFFTTKPPGKGTGLGLHTTYEIVRRHGGDIEVDSRPGETTFRVRLPVRLSRPGGASEQPPHPT